MRCVTWTRDSNGLFDYESKNIAKKNIKTQTGGKIIRMGDEIQLVSKSYKADPSEKEDDVDTNMIILERNHQTPGWFRIRKDFISQVHHDDDEKNQEMYIVVRNTKSTANNQDYQVSKGDIIKLGRIKFKVKSFFGFKKRQLTQDSPQKKGTEMANIDLESDEEGEDEPSEVNEGLLNPNDTDHDVKSLLNVSIQQSSRSH